MSNHHIPVLLEEVLRELGNTPPPIQKYFDGTFGRGGHARSLMQKHPGIEVYAMDQDQQAIEFGQKEFAGEKIQFFHSGFENFSEVFSPLQKNQDYFDIMLLDLGVSSPQLDQADRGFSFMKPGPLDMRMNQSQDLTAAEILNEWSEEELVELFQDLGELRRPFRVVKAVIQDRKEKPFTDTLSFAGLIERVDGWNRRGSHPATKYFMALRLYVNRELEQVEKALPEMMKALRHEGRLAVITFHSTEDRLVKNIFKSRKDLGVPVHKKVIQPSWHDKKENARARSAKLRIFQRNIHSQEEGVQV